MKSSGFAAVPVLQVETWQTVCTGPGRLDIPSRLLAAANLHGLQETRRDYMFAETPSLHKCL